jgi:hypothetical protein
VDRNQPGFLKMVEIFLGLLILSACSSNNSREENSGSGEPVKAAPVDIEITKCYVADDGPHMMVTFNNNSAFTYDMHFKVRIFSIHTKLVKPDPDNPPKEWVRWFTKDGAIDPNLAQKIYDSYVETYWHGDPDLLYEEDFVDTLHLVKELEVNNWRYVLPIQKKTLPKKGEIITEGVRCTFLNTSDDLQNVFPNLTSAGIY